MLTLPQLQQPYRGVQLNHTHPLARRLIGYWPFNDGTGLKTWDYSGNANQGTLEGTAPAWVAGEKGYAINFPGANERIDCGNKPPLDDIGNGDFSISFRMKSKDAIPLSSGRMFNKNEDNPNRFHIDSAGVQNKLRFFISKSGTVIAPVFDNSNPFDTIWHHIVVTINRITDKVLAYVDTIKDSVEGDLSTLPADCSNTGRLSWGARDNGVASYEGLLSNCMVHNRVLLQEEINWLYREPYALFSRPRYYFFIPRRMIMTISSKSAKIRFGAKKPRVTFEGA